MGKKRKKKWTCARTIAPYKRKTNRKSRGPGRMKLRASDLVSEHKRSKLKQRCHDLRFHDMRRQWFTRAKDPVECFSGNKKSLLQSGLSLGMLNVIRSLGGSSGRELLLQLRNLGPDVSSERQGVHGKSDEINPSDAPPPRT
jgi:hypothetical protein